MSFTGRLGTTDSLPGRIVLGLVPPTAAISLIPINGAELSAFLGASRLESSPVSMPRGAGPDIAVATTVPKYSHQAPERRVVGTIHTRRLR